MGAKHACDLVTRFENGYYLTTSESVEAGMIPRPPKLLLQIFPRATYDTMVTEHRESYRYMDKDGIRTFDIPEEEFRDYFMKSYRKSAADMKKLPLWPINLIIRTITRPGKAYCRSIKEQYPDGIPRYGWIKKIKN